jgi:hypothetical protein
VPGDAKLSLFKALGKGRFLPTNLNRIELAKRVTAIKSYTRR